MRHLVRVSVVVLPAAALATALAAGCTSAPGHPAAQAPSSSRRRPARQQHRRVTAHHCGPGGQHPPWASGHRARLLQSHQ